MKELGYKIFAILYRMFCLFPIKNNWVFLVMTHDAGPTGNVGVMRDYLAKQNSEYRFFELHREDTRFGKSIRKMVHFFLVDAYHLARAKAVFLDNMFLPMAYMKFRPQVKVIQMWHGTGVIKKIGADVNHNRLGELERLANQNNTYLICGSLDTKRIYQNSFSMQEENVVVTGMPRSDAFFDEKVKAEGVSAFYQAFPQCRGKRLVLYAPTFRDSEIMNPHLALEAESFANTLPDDCVLGLRLHPFVAKAYENHCSKLKRVVDFSSYQSLNYLLFATDLLITDYSSIIFDYATLLRPMVFYAYDLEEFEKESRGFYWDYESYVPGPVVNEQKQLEDAVNKILFMSPQEVQQKYSLDAFFNQAFYYKDTNSAKRVADLLQD